MKKRLIPCIFLKDGLIIRSEKFSIHQIIGNPVSEVKRYNEWAVDEIVYIDLSKDQNYDLRRNDMKVKDIVKSKFDLIKEVSKSLFCSISIRWGIRSIDDIKRILNNGADKVILNTILFLDKAFLTTATRIFGAQALVACIDYKDDSFVYYSHSKVKSEYTVLEWSKKLELEGIGEIILNNVDRDGVGSGYDVKVIQEVVNAVSVPVVALAGAGDYFDFVECFTEANPSAVAAGNIFHFKEHSYWHAKNVCKSQDIDIRNVE